MAPSVVDGAPLSSSQDLSRRLSLKIARFGNIPRFRQQHVSLSIILCDITFII